MFPILKNIIESASGLLPFKESIEHQPFGLKLKYFEVFNVIISGYMKALEAGFCLMVISCI